MFKFYTNPPCEYSKILMKFSDYLNSTIYLNNEYIIDSGVYELQKNGEYDIKKYRILHITCHQPNIEFVIPDYPSDLIGDAEENIEKSFENIEYFKQEYPKQNWIPVVQFLTANFPSFQESFKRFIDLYPEDKRIGIGNLCMNHDVKFYGLMERYLRKYQANGYKFHVFGLYLKALPLFKFWKFLSWDGMKWTRPVNGDLPNHSCKTQAERIEFFNAYLQRIEKILEKPVKTLRDYGVI